MIGNKNGARVRDQTEKGQVRRTDGIGNGHLNYGVTDSSSETPPDSRNSAASTPGADSFDIVPFAAVIAAAVIVPLLLGAWAWFAGT